MKKKNTKEIDAIIWLTATMPMNKTFDLGKEQRIIIMDIFLFSGIKLPIKPEKAYNYYFEISDDWKTIKKKSYDQ